MERSNDVYVCANIYTDQFATTARHITAWCIEAYNYAIIK